MELAELRKIQHFRGTVDDPIIKKLKKAIKSMYS
jgi:hypothetical protein